MIVPIGTITLMNEKCKWSVESYNRMLEIRSGSVVWAGYYRYHRFGFNLPVAYYFIATSVLSWRWCSGALRNELQRIPGSGC